MTTDPCDWGPIPMQEFPAPSDKPSIRCLVRNSLVPNTPEERVRQSVVLWLRDIVGWPLELVSVEFNLTRHHDSSERADIVLWECSVPEKWKQGYDGSAFCVVECKAPKLYINDDDLGQAHRYAEKLRAKYVIATNCQQLHCAELGAASSLLRTERIPTRKEYEERDARIVPYKPRRFRRPTAADLSDAKFVQEFWNELVQREWLVSTSQADLVPFMMDFLGLLFDREEPTKPSLPWTGYGISILEDWGRRERRFGNAGGGNWDGHYRTFLVRDGGREIEMHVSLVASAPKTADPAFGNRKGGTYLIVALNNHNSIQLCMEKYHSCQSGRVTIVHDGRITVGKGGAAPRIDLMRFVMKEHPSLRATVDRLHLGTLPARGGLEWEDLEDFLLRLLKYALVRDQFRATLSG